MNDQPQEACGIVGIYSPEGNAARTAFFGLFSLQHRGQESAGIGTNDGHNFHLHTEMGLLNQAFHEFDLHRLPGDFAIGHTRYSTTGESSKANAQPIAVQGLHGQILLGHNGNLINALDLRREMATSWDCNFATSTDSEVIAQMLVNAPGKNWGERISYLFRKLQGAYSLVVLLDDGILAIRDPLGVRPLCIGQLGDGWVVASESCALDNLGARFMREVEAGEGVFIGAQGPETLYQTQEGQKGHCVFETIYFARPDSNLEGKLVYVSRQEMGRQLAREHPVDADVVIAIPDSANPAAVGYAQESSIAYREGLVKNRYVGRTFIEPDQRIRDIGVRLKFNPLPAVLEGQRVVVVDDSIVRGTTTPHVVNLIRQAGAREVHLRVCAPPIISPCYFGVDFATRAELIGANMTIPEICQFVGADSLGYLTLDGLFKAIDASPTNYCYGCFSGRYPIDIQLDLDKLILEKA